MKRFDRRTLLRGTLVGGAVTVGLPLLDCFLNDNGDALAQGAPLPLRFGAWMWGCGMNPDRWNPKSVGPDYDLPIELQALDRELAGGAKVRDYVSVFSGFDVKLDGRPNFPHTAGLMGTLTANLPLEDYTVPAPTLDTIIAAEIGGLTRFRSLEMSCTGNPNQAYSFESQGVPNAPEISPTALYTRIFGPDFADPNAGPFIPDPRLMLRQSVLSAVKEDRERLLQRVGAHDRQRLDQYFTSVRQLEQQIDVLLAGPPDLESCRKAPAPGADDLGVEAGTVAQGNPYPGRIFYHVVVGDDISIRAVDETRPDARPQEAELHLDVHHRGKDAQGDLHHGFLPRLDYALLHGLDLLHRLPLLAAEDVKRVSAEDKGHDKDDTYRYYDRDHHCPDNGLCSTSGLGRG